MTPDYFNFCLQLPYFSQQSTLSFVVSQGTDQQLMHLGLDRLKTSSTELEKLKASSSDLNKLRASPDLKSNSDLANFKGNQGDFPSELMCNFKRESELNDLKLIKKDKVVPTNQVLRDSNSNNKPVDDYDESVL